MIPSHDLFVLTSYCIGHLERIRNAKTCFRLPLPFTLPVKVKKIWISTNTVPPCLLELPSEVIHTLPISCRQNLNQQHKLQYCFNPHLCWYPFGSLPWSIFALIFYFLTLRNHSKWRWLVSPAWTWLVTVHTFADNWLFTRHINPWTTLRSRKLENVSRPWIQKIRVLLPMNWRVLWGLLGNPIQAKKYRLW